MTPPCHPQPTSDTVEYCRSLIQQGEDMRVEFKTSFQKEVIETLTVFKESFGSAQESLVESKVQGESEGVNVGVNVGVNGLLSYIQSHPGQRAGEMAVAFKLTKRTIERWLKQLKEANAIEFRGAPKTGGYFLTAKEAPST